VTVALKYCTLNNHLFRCCRDADDPAGQGERHAEALPAAAADHLPEGAQRHEPHSAVEGRVGKKPSPVGFFGFFWFLSFFLGFFGFFGFFIYICPKERVFRVFSVSRILLSASRL
jgi:hypothetical protein